MSNESFHQFRADGPVTYTEPNTNKWMVMITAGLLLLSVGVFIFNKVTAPKSQTPAQQLTAVAPVQSVATAVNTAQDAVYFIKAPSVSDAKTKIRRYERTTSVLGQCGLRYASAKSSYERTNKSMYTKISSKEKARLKKAKGKSHSKPKPGNVNAGQFQMKMSKGTHNPRLASAKRQSSVKSETVQQQYTKPLSKQDCKTLSQMAQQGDFNITA